MPPPLRPYWLRCCDWEAAASNRGGQLRLKSLTVPHTYSDSARNPYRPLFSVLSSSSSPSVRFGALCWAGLSFELRLTRAVCGVAGLCSPAFYDTEYDFCQLLWSVGARFQVRLPRLRAPATRACRPLLMRSRCTVPTSTRSGASMWPGSATERPSWRWVAQPVHLAPCLCTPHPSALLLGARPNRIVLHGHELQGNGQRRFPPLPLPYLLAAQRHRSRKNNRQHVGLAPAAFTRTTSEPSRSSFLSFPCHPCA